MIGIEIFAEEATMIKKSIGIGIAIALALVIGIVISGGIRITKANTRVATLPAHGSRVLLLNELGRLELNSNKNLTLRELGTLNQNRLLATLTNNLLEPVHDLNRLNNTRALQLDRLNLDRLVELS
jgi:nucleoside-triphosphatase THEP1